MITSRIFAGVAAAIAIAAGGWQVVVAQQNAPAPNDRVQFPEDYKAGIHYTTVNRGAIREEIYTSREAIQAAKSARPLPDGTVITMEDYRDGKLYRYIVMEKRNGWGDARPENIRNGDWEFQSFRPDRTVNRSENAARCMGCHKAQEKNDYVFTLDQMRAVKLDEAQLSLRLRKTLREPPPDNGSAPSVHGHATAGASNQDN